MESEKELGYSKGEDITLKMIEKSSHRRISSKDSLEKYLAKVNNIFIVKSKISQIRFSPFVNLNISNLRNLLHLEIRDSKIERIDNLSNFKRFVSYI